MTSPSHARDRVTNHALSELEDLDENRNDIPDADPEDDLLRADEASTVESLPIAVTTLRPVSQWNTHDWGAPGMQHRRLGDYDD